MSYAGIRLVGDDEMAVTRLRGLLDFVGEPVREDIDDAVMLVADRHGRWPNLTVQPAALILVGEGTPPETPCLLGQLREPFDLGALLECLHRLHAFRSNRQRKCGAGGIFFGSVIGISEAMAHVRALMARVYGCDTAVLIRGEAGTGKEVVARALHEASPRRRGPFLVVNCGGIPAEILERELFGYDKEAFSDALTAKAGCLELAARGTLCLDEIGDMPLPLQRKLQRVIQERRFQRVGTGEWRHADVRIVTTSRRDLEAMVADGSFRADLFCRLTEVALNLPPLRDRPEDIEPLTYAIAGRVLAEQGRRVLLAPDAMAVLKSHPWPGNVRELKNLLERLAVEFPDQVVSAAELPLAFHGSARGNGTPGMRVAAATALLPVNGLDLKDYLGRLERTLIEQALLDTNSVVAHAAARLHIRRTTLVEKMRKYGIERP